MMAADEGPGEIVYEQVMRRVQRLHEDVAAVEVLCFEVGDIGVDRRNAPESFFEVENCKSPVIFKIACEFGKDFFHSSADGKVFLTAGFGESACRVKGF